MAKIFYTDRDIEDLNNSGVSSLVVNDDVVVTDLGREKAMKLGFELVREEDQPIQAPVRTAPAKKIVDVKPAAKAQSAPAVDKVSLEQKVTQAVKAKVGDSVDGKLLETIIKRVLKSVGSN
ncbi:MAG: hypothetical protein HON98_08485 [Chloroflexi bacterium]|jgi:hypothetical protein|nr:hypothetical protein [Chloroflexota bacterium]MBT3669979.1 hypothetical protein [Chloroflexota bacterium]MBT4002998.1 hypothetical protein [Chloroflexota bacterium]MBT4306410.1 hypothetical protein [Chloroflexota bacterium]MBT4534617.1 hypothetical protein [Chloroflexota bacterium]